MSWWYFHIINNQILLADKDSFGERPLDANSSNGNPYTPWYQEEDHKDEFHIHIKARSYCEAVEKALSMLM